MAIYHLIDPASALAFHLRRGDYLRIIDIEGQQVGDLVLFNANDYTEKLSTSYSRSEASDRPNLTQIYTPLYLSEGNLLMSTIRNPMMTIVEDSPKIKGRHDIFFRCCSRRSWELFNLQPKDGCLELLTKALAHHGIAMGEIPDPFNVFMNTVWKDGVLTIEPPVSEAGDYIILRAEMDLLCAISACPENDHLLVNGPIPHHQKPLGLEIYSL